MTCPSCRRSTIRSRNRNRRVNVSARRGSIVRGRTRRSESGMRIRDGGAVGRNSLSAIPFAPAGPRPRVRTMIRRIKEMNTRSFTGRSSPDVKRAITATQRAMTAALETRSAPARNRKTRRSLATLVATPTLLQGGVGSNPYRYAPFTAPSAKLSPSRNSRGGLVWRAVGGFSYA